MSTDQSTPKPFRGKELTGVRFGRWLVLSRQGPGKHGKPTWWLCRCDCGVERAVQARHLNNGASRSCGCTKISHRGTGTAEYNIYCKMIYRCHNPEDKDYPGWGGKGVTVCQRWRDNFLAFLEDMGPRPSPRHSIDRYPDRTGPYAPENCRWATAREQANNRQGNVILEHNGESHTLAEWARIKGINEPALRMRFKYGWSVADALDRPFSQRHSNRGSKGILIVEYKSERLPITEWGRRLGINPATLRTRLNRDGWSVTEALNTPARPIRKSNP